MVDIHSGLMSGDELVNEFSTTHSATKIFLFLILVRVSMWSVIRYWEGD